jgi:2'-5' RNA ligase
MRLFIASTFPAEILHDLNERVTRLRPKLPAAGWVREEAQHLTFAFLGEQPPSLVQKMKKPLQEAVARHAGFDATLAGSGVFPNPRHARVGWVGISPQENFGEIAATVREVVTAHGVVLDRSEFRPHLTLMRIRDPWPPASIDLFSRSLGDYRSQPFRVDSLTLFASELNPKGAVHTALETFALG